MAGIALQANKQLSNCELLERSGIETKPQEEAAKARKYIKMVGVVKCDNSVEGKC